MQKIKQFGLHFLISCLMLVGALGVIKYYRDTGKLNEQIYLGSKGSGKTVVSKAPKRTIIEKIFRERKLLPALAAPKEKIRTVVEVRTTTSCPSIGITILKDGTVISDSPYVKEILVENYMSFFGNRLGIRLAYIAYFRKPGDPGWYKIVDGDLGLQLHYWSIWRLYPELTITRHMFGAGLSYNPKIGPIDNTYISGGYGYHFSRHGTSYVGVSVKF